MGCLFCAFCLPMPSWFLFTCLQCTWLLSFLLRVFTLYSSLNTISLSGSTETKKTNYTPNFLKWTLSGLSATDAENYSRSFPDAWAEKKTSKECFLWQFLSKCVLFSLSSKVSLEIDDLFEWKYDIIIFSINTNLLFAIVIHNYGQNGGIIFLLSGLFGACLDFVADRAKKWNKKKSVHTLPFFGIERTTAVKKETYRPIKDGQKDKGLAEGALDVR